LPKARIIRSDPHRVRCYREYPVTALEACRDVTESEYRCQSR
jgi:hypothetical protein